MNKSVTKLDVENGKYTFIVEDGIVRVLRYGQPWIEQMDLGAKALIALIFQAVGLTVPPRDETVSLPVPYRAQGQQLAYDGWDKVFCDLYEPTQVLEYGDARAAAAVSSYSRCDNLVKKLQGIQTNLRHQRRFGHDTLGAWRNALCYAEGDIEEALNEYGEHDAT